MTFQLRYTLTLQRGAVLATHAENPNLVTSDGAITGSAILGAAVAAFLSGSAGRVAPTDAHRDPTFAAWFLKGGLRFLTAYPTDAGEQGARLLPAPLSLLAEKSNMEQVYDLSDDDKQEDAQKNNVQLLPISGYVRCEGSDLIVASPRREMRYHNARPNRLKGRADEGDGAVFVYESLEAGQTFAGRILGTEAALNAFLAATGWGLNAPCIQVGRSITAEYGGQAQLRWQTAAPEPFTREPGEAGPDAEPQDSRLVVTLLSPLIGRDAGGRPAPAFPLAEMLQELAAALDGSGLTPLRIARAYCRQIMIGGYVRAWNLPRPQCAALAAGSVFIIETTGTPAANYHLIAAERHSLGMRVGEGFGRFALDWHTPLNISSQSEPDRSAPLRPHSPVPTQLSGIYEASRLRLLLDAAASLGMKDGSGSRNSGGDISAAQLGRVIHTLRGPGGFADLALLLVGLRGPASEQLRAVRIENMRGSLLEVLQNPNIKARLQLPAPVKSIGQPDGLELPDVDAAQETQNEYKRVYLLNLCTQLARGKRQEDAVSGSV